MGTGGFSLTMAGIVSAVQGFAGIIGSNIGGILSDKYVAAHPDVNVDHMRRASLLAEDVVSVLACFILATGPEANTIAFVLIFQNIVAPILGAPNRAIMIEMSAKYAAAIQGAVNCADNLTLYALSSTLNGMFLDAGGCRNCAADDHESPGCRDEETQEQADLNDNQTFWARDESSCNVQTIGLYAEKEDLICIRSSVVGWNETESCTLSHTIEKAEEAVEDPDACHQTWLNFFLLCGVLRLVGGLLFYFQAKGYINLTAKIEAAAAERRGGGAAAANGAVEPDAPPPDVTTL
eukprot:COSAG04_NODE_893_length_9595_cov_4.687763_3_plen_293_part_00